jgi:xanthine dehydrogenase accessory factor
MEGADREVVEAIEAWSQQQRVYLFTVAATWGSSPRPPGAMLAIREDGCHAGSVSGGCVEEELVERVVTGGLADSAPHLIDFGVDVEQARRFGLPCGGRLQLLAERIDAAAQWSEILGSLRNRKCLQRRVCLNTGEASLHPADPRSQFQFDGENLAKVFGPQWQLLIIGANQIARYLTSIAHSLDYRVIICDPRKPRPGYWDEQDAVFDSGMPDDVVRSLADDQRSAVVALSHDPKLDDMALMEALTSRAFYVGALGSRRNNELRRRRLLQLDLSPTALQRLSGPVGLPIGGRTPPEIALAIAAEMTALRHGRRLCLETHSTILPDNGQSSDQ